MFYRANYQSPLGKIVLLSDHQALYGVWFEQQRHFGANYNLDAASSSVPRILEQTQQWLDAYFAGQQSTSTKLVVKLTGTVFQRQVWTLIQQVPYGKCWSYQQLAVKLQQRYGHKTAPRAIGNAVGRNPLSVIIPCHRIVASNGNLTGYAGGLEKKRALLALEGWDQQLLQQDRIY
ncbi:MAG: methylated-DNA--[protein]-cysteine S-methyltransferase [Liquorilactobacillus ghanensis]|uniref:methylated-DNA--[protein]-cysteine S-methyltransferase n=1 Tax=Liquorilactobacillus ghanensis TaxID=399370 RepID=UPI0039EA12A1